MQIKIRETMDLHTWRELDKICLPHDDWEPYDCEFYWLAFVDGEPAGYCSMALIKQSDRLGFFTRAGVLPKYRNLGIHHRMITVRKRLAKKLGLEGVVTYATPDNVNSCNHLVAKGFRLYTPKESWILDRKAQFLYFKLLF